LLPVVRAPRSRARCGRTLARMANRGPSAPRRRAVEPAEALAGAPRPHSDVWWPRSAGLRLEAPLKPERYRGIQRVSRAAQRLAVPDAALGFSGGVAVRRTSEHLGSGHGEPASRPLAGNVDAPSPQEPPELLAPARDCTRLAPRASISLMRSPRASKPRQAARPDRARPPGFRARSRR
jgi:hypothetical protein